MPARRRVLLPVLAFVTALLAPALVPAASAWGDSGTESQFFSYANSARSQHGLSAYASASDLNAVARRWAAHMAATRTLGHNPNTSSDVCCWQSLGENVGVGANASEIQQAFMNSAPHRSNILSSTYTQIGIGTARGSDGRLYVDEIFRRPSGASAPHHYTPARTSTAPVRASRSETRTALPTAVVRRPAAVRPRAAALIPLSAVFLRQVRQQLPAGVRTDAISGAFGYLQLMTALDR